MRGIRIFPVVLFLGGTLSAGRSRSDSAGERVEVALPLRPRTPFTAPGELSTVTFVQIDSPPDGKTQNPGANDGAGPSQGQAQGNRQGSTQAHVTCGLSHVGQCLKDLGHDQAGIWRSPLRIRSNDAYWLVPFAAATGVALHYDAQAQQNLGIDKSRIDTSNIVSGFGSPYATLGGAAGVYFLGLGTHNEHLAETGRLGAEAVIDSLCFGSA